MKSVSLIIGAGVLILLFGAILAGINDFRTDNVEEPHNVTTAANVTTVAIVLSQELFGDNTISATVSSNLTDDAPVPSSYASTTQTLTISGLQAGSYRRLTIDYEVDGLWDYPGAGLVARMWPVMLGIGVIGIIVGAVVAATKRGE